MLSAGVARAVQLPGPAVQLQGIACTAATVFCTANEFEAQPLDLLAVPPQPLRCETLRTCGYGSLLFVVVTRQAGILCADPADADERPYVRHMPERPVPAQRKRSTLARLLLNFACRACSLTASLSV